ncbi:Thioesterase superfamily protein [Aquisphaera giovannonii]|uniref:Thioesterase superfamily protein n=1 Tax=Aquisphaera giovannonii TaxID=406548 RepID=A0A5B9VYT3_9BACT|nr:acyl-CoA thioesterase [Aquisphaera giovannonii]QEH33526.1 Thioesterase superfamily protein [Aquisphaera giovannonii]
MDAEAKMKELTAGFPVVAVQPVQWGEQDPLGHVNHVTYFRWYETARLAYFYKVGLMELHRDERIGPILARVSNDYRRQLTYPDTVHIAVKVVRLGRSSMDLEHKIFSLEQRALAAEGTSTMVTFDYKANRAHPIPARIRHAIEGLEGHAL